MTEHVPSALELRPRRTTDRTFIEHRPGDGEYRVFAECPSCEAVVDPR